MKTIVIGTGIIGNAVASTFRDNGHEVVHVGRTRGDVHADLTDSESLRTLFSEQAPFDAVANAAGEVFLSGLEDATDDQWTRSVASKGMGQINLVRAGLPHIADHGSFTLITGVFGHEPCATVTMLATINRMVEGFVFGAATELPRGVRINCVSPAVVAESTQYREHFPGFTRVPVRDVAMAYLRSASNPYTGEIFALHRTD